MRHGLTENEITFIKATLNYDNREMQHDDNYSNAGIEEGCEALGWKPSQVKGLVSSLTQKGMGCMDDDGNDLFWLSPKGVDTIFDIIDEEKA